MRWTRFQGVAAKIFPIWATPRCLRVMRSEATDTFLELEALAVNTPALRPTLSPGRSDQAVSIIKTERAQNDDAKLPAGRFQT
jgi:hypothetical protein